MRRLILSMVALGLVVALWGVVTAAPVAGPAMDAVQQPQVDLWMSTESGGSPMVAFASGAQTLYAILEYNDLTNQSVHVTVIDDGSIVLLDDTRPYSGSGQQVFTLTGTDMFAAYQDKVAAHGQNMSDKIAEAVQYVQPGASVTETLQITPTVQAAVTEASSMKTALERVQQRFPVSPGVSELLGQAIAAVDDVIEAGQEATQAGRTLEEIRTRVNTMSARGADAVKSAQAARIDPPAGLSIPDTPACRTYVSNLYLGSRQVTSVEWIVGDPGPPHSVEVVASPSSIYATSVVVAPGYPVTHTTTVKATVMDAQCRPVPDVTVEFATSDPALGTVSPGTVTSSAYNSPQPGVAEATLTAGSEVGDGTVVITAAAGSAVGTEHVTLIGPVTSLAVRATQKYMTIFGEANRVVVDARDAHNWPVADGTEITFRVEPANLAAWTQETVVTHGGLASTYLNPLSMTGRVTVTVSADGVQSAPLALWIVGRAEDGELAVSADPSVVYTLSPLRFSQLTVQAWDGDVDGDGNPEPAGDGTRIRLEIDDPTLAGFQDGDPRCDYCAVVVPLSNGMATARLFAKEGAEGEAEISACLQGTTGCKPGGPFGTTMIQFVPEARNFIFLPLVIDPGR